MYRCNFYDLDNLVMTLEIEGETRCDILKNILNSELYQVGDFIIEEYELDSIIFNFVYGKMKENNDDSYLDDNRSNEYMYRLKSHAELGLYLSPFLSENNKEANSIDIFKFFCQQIKEQFEEDNDTLKIEYKIERI
jgi:hypothetical protein